jgi:hypothetical protein
MAINYDIAAKIVKVETHDNFIVIGFLMYVLSVCY